MERASFYFPFRLGQKAVGQAPLGVLTSVSDWHRSSRFVLPRESFRGRCVTVGREDRLSELVKGNGYGSMVRKARA